ncbi:hypothetical protein AB0D98_19195 [Streptomyces sp. NPDC047987]|uniref:hypothetical protein n=1 Tax=unclassified Streptomyces TaxID=2593676 RepID=UPI00341C7892
MATANEAPASSMAAGRTSHTQNQADQRPAGTFGYTRAEQIEALHKLREPFLPTEIRHLPRVWCQACKNSRGQGCQKHTIVKCEKCNQKMPRNGHIDLAYVGHAEATNRLLNVDPFWDWEPLTVDERGLPQVDGYRGLWIRLTVCGMSRLGYGHAGDKTGGDAVKETIGDAIRNAGWDAFLAHFEKRKVSIGTCARAFGTPCIHEHACVRCSLLRPDPSQRARLAEIRDNLIARIAEAEREGWLGEVEGLQISLVGAEEKLRQLDHHPGQHEAVDLGIPVTRGSR